MCGCSRRLGSRAGCRGSHSPTTDAGFHRQPVPATAKSSELDRFLPSQWECRLACPRVTLCLNSSRTDGASPPVLRDQLIFASSQW